MEREAVGNLLVRSARIQGGAVQIDDGRVCGGRTSDVRIVEGRIAEVAPDLGRCPGEDSLDCRGGTLVPGLHDHHLHLRSLAAHECSVLVDPAHVGDAGSMAAALRAARPDASGWRRAVGYHESVAGDLDRGWLDAVLPGALVRVQHRSGAMWVVSSPGVAALGLEGVDMPNVERDAAGEPTGRLFRMDEWLADRLAERDPLDHVATISTRLAARGVTGLTDATPGTDEATASAMVDAVREGRIVQRLHLMCPPEIPVPAHPLVGRGPQKFILDDDRLPGIEEFTSQIRHAHDRGAPVAVHCVSTAQLVLTMAALDAAGVCSGDRIEHGSVVPEEAISMLAASGVTVVTNPGLVFERGDTYLEDTDIRDRESLYRCSSLIAAGVKLAAGTDAPFGSDDPWTAILAAHSRCTRGGRPIARDEAVPVGTAIGLFSGHPGAPAHKRRICPGEPADLMLLDGGELPTPLGAAGSVAATIVAGRVVHLAR